MGPSSCLANQINNFLAHKRGQTASEIGTSITEHICEHERCTFIYSMEVYRCLHFSYNPRDAGLRCADLISVEKALCVQVPSKQYLNTRFTCFIVIEMIR